MRRGEKFWCWWLHRYVYFVRAMKGSDSLVFEDICDVKFVFTPEQVKQLTRRARV